MRSKIDNSLIIMNIWTRRRHSHANRHTCRKFSGRVSCTPTRIVVLCSDALIVLGYSLTQLNRANGSDLVTLSLFPEQRTWSTEFSLFLILPSCDCQVYLELSTFLMIFPPPLSHLALKSARMLTFVVSNTIP